MSSRFVPEQVSCEQKMRCPCGSVILTKNLQAHQRTKKHLASSGKQDTPQGRDQPKKNLSEEIKALRIKSHKVRPMSDYEPDDEDDECVDEYNPVVSLLEGIFTELKSMHELMDHVVQEMFEEDCEEDDDEDGPNGDQNIKDEDVGCAEAHEESKAE